MSTTILVDLRDVIELARCRVVKNINRSLVMEVINHLDLAQKNEWAIFANGPIRILNPTGWLVAIAKAPKQFGTQPFLQFSALTLSSL